MTTANAQFGSTHNGPMLPAASAPRLADGLAISGSALLLYALCGRDVWHAHDAHVLMLHFGMGGTREHVYYTFYMPTLLLLHAVLSPLAISPYRCALLLSAAGTAFGVLCTHLAARRVGADRGAASFAALLVATMPAVAYFAVIVEVHGALIGCCGIVWLLLANWAARPRVARAVACGAGLVFAYLAHPLAAAMGLAMWPLSRCTRPPVPRREFLVGSSIALACLLLGCATLPPMLRALGCGPDTATAFELVRVRSGIASGRSILTLLLREWLVPCLPVSVALLLLCLVRSARHAAVAALAATLPFLVASGIVLVDAENERGGYAAIVAGPAAIVVANHVRSSWLRALALAVAVPVAVGLSLQLQPAPRTVATVAAVEQAVQGRQTLWLIGDAGGPDGEAWLTRFADCEGIVLANFLASEPAALAAALQHLGTIVADREARGMQAIVTSTTLDTLAMMAAGYAGAKTMHEWLLVRRGQRLGAADGVEVFAIRSGG